MNKQTDEAFIGDMIALIGQELPTLRDRFAIAALQGMLAAGNSSRFVTSGILNEVECYAKKSYRIADEMIKAREVKK